MQSIAPGVGKEGEVRGKDWITRAVMRERNGIRNRSVDQPRQDSGSESVSKACEGFSYAERGSFGDWTFYIRERSAVDRSKSEEQDFL